MHGLDRPRQVLAAALAALAGFVDAEGFLSADRYFVSFMSGNTTRLATDLVVAGARPAIPALLIIGFVLGVAAGHFVAYRGGPLRKPAVLLLVTVLLALGSLSATTGFVAPMMACLVLAMGAINNTLQREESPVALTYLTGALVRIGQALGSLATGRRQDPAWPFLIMWLALAGGAAAGALAFLSLGPASLWIAVAAAVLLTLAGYRLARRMA